MTKGDTRYWKTGVYTIREASILSGISESRIRRWMQGYSYRSGDDRHSLPPVWKSTLPAINGRRAVSFADLVEMRFVEAFVQLGVSWKKIRQAQENARRMFKLDHPFSTNRFKTDGGHILMEMIESPGSSHLFDIESQQQVFIETTTPLRQELEIDDHDHVLRWWPLGRNGHVVLDPVIHLGRPVTAGEGIPTAILFAASLQGYSEPDIAAWYEADVLSVMDAVRFESELRARAPS